MAKCIGKNSTNYVHSRNEGGDVDVAAPDAGMRPRARAPEYAIWRTADPLSV